jgi:hypothetical protein
MAASLSVFFRPFGVDREKETNVVRREWEPEDLIECWTLDEAEFELLANKTGATRLGFALLLKFFELEARFPRREDVPRAAAESMAGQVRLQGRVTYTGLAYTVMETACFPKSPPASQKHNAEATESWSFQI